MLKAEKITYRVQAQTLIDSISLEVQSGECVGLIGPNGSGKSTFLKHAYRVLQPHAGRIWLDDAELLRMSAKQTARKLAVVSQESQVLFDFRVSEIVLMGRSPHKRALEPDTDEDYDIVRSALERVSLESYMNRSFMSLSGGEKQRVLIARALAQQAQYLILDEPTNHLDIRHQLQIMDLVKGLGITVLAALHDLNIASTYCDRLYVLKSGRLTGSGTPEQVLSRELLRAVFEVETEIILHPVTGKPHITFISERFGRLHAGTRTPREVGIR